MDYDLLMHKLSPNIVEVAANTGRAVSFISVWCDPHQPDTNSDGQPYIYCPITEFGYIVNRAQMAGLTLHAVL